MWVIFGYSAIIPKKNGQRIPPLELRTLSWYAGLLTTRPTSPLSLLNHPFFFHHRLFSGNSFLLLESLMFDFHSTPTSHLHKWLSITIILFCNPFFYVCIVSDASFLLEESLKGMATAEDFHLDLSKHSLLVYSSPHPLSAPLQCIYSFTLSFHLTTSLPLLLVPSISLTYPFSTNSKLFFPSIRPNHLKVSFSLIPLPHTLLHLHHATSIIRAFPALTSPSCHATWPSQIIHFCSPFILPLYHNVYHYIHPRDLTTCITYAALSLVSPSMLPRFHFYIGMT